MVVALSLLPACAQILISPSTLPTGQVLTGYSQELTASGGSGTYTFKLTSGSFPSGLPAFALSATGLIAGTPDGCPSFLTSFFFPCLNPNEPMNSTFTVQATDSAGNTGSQTYTIGVYWNPSEAAFDTEEVGYDADLVAGLTKFAPPAFGGHLAPAAPEFRQASTDTVAIWSAWIDGFHKTGATIVNIEPDMDCLFNNFAACQALYTGAIAHAHSLGMTISLNPEFYGRASCGDAGCSPAGAANGYFTDCQNLIGHAINATPGNGVSDWYACMTTKIPALGMSAFQWMITNWMGNGDRFVPLHEPTTQAGRWNEGNFPGGCSSATQPTQAVPNCAGIDQSMPGGTGNTCQSDWLNNFLMPLLNPTTGLISAWASAAGLNIHIGVTTLKAELSNDYSPTYADVFAKNLPASVDMGYDIYNFAPTDLTTYTDSISSVHQDGHLIYFEEFAPPYWVENNGLRAENCAIKGCYSCDWQTNQIYQNFMEAFLSFAGSQEALSASLYSTELLAGCSDTQPTSCESVTVLAAASQAFLGGGISPVAQRIAAILTPGGDQPSAIAKTAGDQQSTPPGQAFPIDLMVNVADMSGNPIPGANVTFTAVPGQAGASGAFAASPLMPIQTDLLGNATAPTLTANDTGGPFTVMASVNGVTTTFALSNGGASVVTVSSASGTAPVAPDSIVSMYAANIDTGVFAATAEPPAVLPTMLGGVSATITDRSGTPAPISLIVVTPDQVNAVLPAGLQAGAATIDLVSSSGAQIMGNLVLSAVAPSLFTANESGQGTAAAQVVIEHQDGSQTFIANIATCSDSGCTAMPINLGSSTDQAVLVLFGTGIRGADASNVTVTVGTVQGTVLYAGAQGNGAPTSYYGLDQVNVLLPRSLIGSGVVNVVLKVGGLAANTVTVDIQ
jgi:uncharacterized protein (TIGR03437 family)